jgi:polyisoprenoid-binding protein YceI
MFAAALVVGHATAAWAQLPPGVYAGERNAALAPAGSYAVDPAHTAVLAKVSHIGYGLSVFRFDKVGGVLSWDPAQPERSSLKASVETASISTPVPGFATELSAPAYLNAAAFPTATFASTAFRRVDPTHGRVEGEFTLMGRTRPVSFDVTLMGAGKGFMGHARIGVQAIGRIDPRDYGMNPLFSTPIELEIDAEFAQTP